MSRDADPLRAAFDLRVAVPVDTKLSGTLVFTLRSGRTLEVPAAELRTLTIAERRTAGPQESLTYAIEKWKTVARLGTANRALSALLRLYSHGVVALVCAGLVALFSLLWSGSHAVERALYGVTVILLGTAGARIALLVLFDASARPADDPRYIYPVAHLIPCAMAVLVWCAVRSRVHRVPSPP